MLLDDRKRRILQAVIDDYIETAEPVASKSLVSRHDFTVRAATVRNEMADLEEMGYLEQPHTSAGRIPSDKGYREYVDSLMRVEPLTVSEKKQISDRMENSVNEMTDMLKDASGALAEKTGYTAITLSPRLKKSYLRQLKMMTIEPGKILVVVVLSAGIVKDRIIRTSDYLTTEQLEHLSHAVEIGLAGKPLEEITLVTVSTAGKDAKLPEPLINQILYEAYVSIKQADNLNVYMDGRHHFFDFPEFGDVKRVRTVLDTLSQDGMIAGYMDSGHHADPASYMIRIGQEITLEGLDECSFITTTYNMGDQLTGHIGIVGPKRMEYSKVISRIDFVRTVLDRRFKIIQNTEKGDHR